MKRYLILAFVVLALAACGAEPTPTAAPTAIAPPAGAASGDTWTRPADGAVMVHVPAGEFLMGSAADDPEVGKYESPQHAVFLVDFWIDRTEVTNAQYADCVEAGACEENGCPEDGDYNAPNQPVVCVNWHKAQAYAAWAGGRLPTEAEWEKAARGTDTRTYPWGDAAPGCKLANYEGCIGRPAAVGSYPDGASPYGALDMAGNVREWVSDWHGREYYAESPSQAPRGPDFGVHRVLRGGAFEDDASSLRGASRAWDDPPYGNRATGFRVAMDSAIAGRDD